MRNILDRLIWVVLFVFFVPTSLVIASWSSLPGDFMFPIKLGLERSLAVIVSPSYEVSGQLQIKYTERRFADAQKLLAIKNSVSGLVYLDEQVATAKTAIEKAPNPAARQVLASQYIATLTQVNGQLEQQKLIITKISPTVGSNGAGPATSAAPSQPSMATALPNEPAASVSSPTATPTQGIAPANYQQNVPTAIPTPTPTLATVVMTTEATAPKNLVVAMQITQTQQKINETIDDLKKEENQDNHGDKENKPTEKPSTEIPDSRNNKNNDK